MAGVIEQQRFYVYAYRIDGQMAYIGKGKGRRAWCHLSNAKNAILRDRISNGKSVRVKIIKQGLSEAEAFQLERKCIAKWADDIANIKGGVRSSTEALLHECLQYLASLKSYEQIRREGDWRGLSLDERLYYRAFIEERLHRFIDIFRKQMASV
jgi:hypothetical protein